MGAGSHQPSECRKIGVFETTGCHCRSPDSGKLRYESRELQKNDSLPLLRAVGGPESVPMGLV